MDDRALSFTDLEIFWRERLRAAHEEYLDASRDVAHAMAECPPDRAACPDRAAAIRMASQRELAAQNEYQRVLAIFTRVVIDRVIPSEEEARQ